MQRSHQDVHDNPSHKENDEINKKKKKISHKISPSSPLFVMKDFLQLWYRDPNE